jgi:hypothetical protein
MMDLKPLKDFFLPDYKKVILLFILEFCTTLILLLFGQSNGLWVYLLSPSALYLESVVDLILSSSWQLAFHGAVSNVIAIIYLYFLSCLIITLYRKVRGE